MAYLNGEKVENDKIIPGKCILVGYFRPLREDIKLYSCPRCQATWVYSEDTPYDRFNFDNCIKAGHLDEPVYKSI